jgi:hypothetical protein
VNTFHKKDDVDTAVEELYVEGSRLGDGTDNRSIHMLRQEEYMKGLI